MTLEQENADLRRQLEEAKAEAAALLDFLETEQQREELQAILLPAGSYQQNRSLHRATLFQKYLVKSGHGYEFLHRMRDLEARVAELQPRQRDPQASEEPFRQSLR